jgi:hypothetical protein
MLSSILKRLMPLETIVERDAVASSGKGPLEIDGNLDENPSQVSEGD